MRRCRPAWALPSGERSCDAAVGGGKAAMLIATPEIGRRRFLLAGAATALIVPSRLAAQQALVPTPPQTAGPFYPDKLPADTDADLVVIRGSGGQGARDRYARE